MLRHVAWTSSQSRRWVGAAAAIVVLWSVPKPLAAGQFEEVRRSTSCFPPAAPCQVFSFQVVNYDAAKDIDTHVHRIGRTGRAGDKEGVAYTLLLPHETRIASEPMRVCY